MSGKAPIALVLGSLALPLAACSAEMEEEAYVSKAPAANVVGAAERCIQTPFIRTTRVYDNRTIDFEMNGNKVYRNTLPRNCPSLGMEERFAYRTNTSQLCNLDTITVLYTDGARGAVCGLGEFVPVEIVKDAAN